MSESCPRAVDIHTHAVPHRLLERVAGGEFPGIQARKAERGPILQFPDTYPSPPIPAPMFDPGALLEATRDQHIVLQLLSPWTDLFGYTLDKKQAIEWSRAYNSELVELCAGSPAHMPMGTVPLTYPEAAVQELVAARDLGCRGIMIGTDVPGMDLGSRALFPVWEAAAELSMPVMVHPTTLEMPSALSVDGLWNAVGRPIESLMALTKLLYSGALTEYPALAVIACHGGGALASALPRVIRNYDLGWTGSEHDVRESVARLYFDSVVIDPNLLRYLLETFGSERFLLGTDLPFPWEPTATSTVMAATSSAAERAMVLRENAERLYGFSAEATACAACAVGSATAPSSMPA